MNEEHLAFAVEGSETGLWDWMVQTGELECNERWAQIVGYSLEELAPLSIETWRKLAHPEDIEKSDNLLEKCFNSEMNFYECEVRMLHRDGHWVYVLDRGKVMECGDDGKPVRMSGTYHDITERKKTEAALRESELALRTILDNTHDAIFIHDVDGSIIDVNRKVLEMYRVSKEDALRFNIRDDYSTAQNPVGQIDYWWKQVLKGKNIVLEWQARRPCDGSAFYVEVSLKKVQLNNRTVVLANVSDISAHKAAENVLREKEEKFRVLVENSLDAIMRMDRQHRYLYVNPIVEKQTGIPPDFFIGKNHEDLGFAQDFVIRYRDAIESVFTTAMVKRMEMKLPSGPWIDCMIMPEMESSGNVNAVIISARDITERKRDEEEKQRLEEQLLQAQKMEAVGRLAGGVAHDFNNMLSIILGQCELSLMELEPEGDLYERIEEIQSAAQRSAELTRQLLAFARKQTIIPRVLNLNETVSSVLKILRRLIGENILLIWSPGDDLWSVQMDPAQVDQILTNLCVNARDAMDGVGRIAIETGNFDFDGEYCEEHAGYMPGQFVMISVSDNGKGMNQETLANLFEPFFTTKGRGQGTGLGLSMVYGIVKQNSGFINVSSVPGEGSTFRIYLPRECSGRRDTLKTKSRGVAAVGNETILFVEDEPTVLDLGRTMLENLGYNVIAAQTPGGAVRLAREFDGVIHLLVTDVVMPEMNGQELAEIISSIHPGIKKLYMSGYTVNVMNCNGDNGDGVHFVQKPFSTVELGAGVREALDGKKSNREGSCPV